MEHLNNGLERDHGHLKQRLRPMWVFECLVSADIVTHGRALIRNLRNRFSPLTADVPCPPRFAIALPQLAGTI